MRIEPELLMAYADGELDDVTAKRVEKAIAADPSLAARIEQHRDLRARLRKGAGLQREVPVSGRRVLGISGKVVNLAKVRKARQQPESNPWWRRTAPVASAALVLGVTLGVVMKPQLQADFVDRSGRLVAAGELSAALTGKLKADADDRSAVRVLATFRNHDGAYCRAFEGTSADGIACRIAGDWHIRQLRASSGSEADKPAVLADARAMMEGAALDAAAEQVALSRGWN